MLFLSETERVPENQLLTFGQKIVFVSPHFCKLFGGIVVQSSENQCGQQKLYVTYHIHIFQAAFRVLFPLKQKFLQICT